VQRGQNVELACRSRGGNPPAEIIWFRNDAKITTAYRREGSVSENVLSFTARAEDEKARYRCEVSNIMSVQPMRVHVDLTVLCKCTGLKVGRSIPDLDVQLQVVWHIALLYEV